MIKLPTPGQLRAARAWVNWSLEDIGERAGIHRQTVYRAEQEVSLDGRRVSADTILALMAVLEAEGIVFEGDWVGRARNAATVATAPAREVAS